MKERMKDKIANAPFLGYDNSADELTLQSDASELGAALYDLSIICVPS